MHIDKFLDSLSPAVLVYRRLRRSDAATSKAHREQRRSRYRKLRRLKRLRWYHRFMIGVSP